MSKKLGFYAVLAALLTMSSNSSALDVLSPEDEEMFLGVDSGNNVRDALAGDDGNNEVKYKELSRGEALHSIPVPDEVNAKAPLYENTVFLKVSPDTPRTVEYPIGKERQERDEWRLEWYDPDAMSVPEEKKVDVKKERVIKKYKEQINDCLQQWQDKLDLETMMMENGKRYDNAAYLSETMQNMELCYKDVGYDIIDHMYGGDQYALNQYEEKIKEFHVDSSSPSFDAKYCGDFCSVQAVASLQLERFEDFRTYLAEMIDKAPMKDIDEIAVTKNTDEENNSLSDEEIYIDDEDVLLIEDNGVLQGNNHQLQRQDQNGIYLDSDGVPLIDEDL